MVRGEMATESVTVLFTDLVGSTQLISRLGEDHAEVLRREHFGIPVSYTHLTLPTILRV